MRLLFIPGFGEDESIFDKLYPLLQGEKVLLSLWKELPNQSSRQLNVAGFAKELMQQYGITQKDVVIGHSTGGWVALFIKQFLNCPLVQISSWTDPKKVVSPVANRHLVYFLAKTGFFFNKPVQQWLLQHNYRGKPSAPVFRNIFTNLITGNKENVVNQLRLILAPVQERITVHPDVVIHAKADTIVRFPDGTVNEVPGDHFALYTHPDLVAKPINQFLTSLPWQ